MSKPGRNDPCYCGSGKKYKNCHMAKDKAVEQEKRTLQDAGKWLHQDFMKYARDERFAESFAFALQLYWKNHYSIENAEEMSMNEALRFFDWFVLDYEQDGSERLIDIYHREKFEDLSEPQQQVIENWLNVTPASAYELTGYEGQNLFVKEFVSRQEYTVFEPAGHGLVQPGDLLLGRLVSVLDRYEFSTVVAYLPQDEIGNLAEKLQEARAADKTKYPEASYEEFMRRNGYLIIHHALDQAEEMGRPAVAAEDPDQAARMTRRAAKQLRKLPKLPKLRR